MSCVANQFVFFFDYTFLNVLANFVPFAFTPQSIVSHDLIKLFEFAKTGNVLKPILFIFTFWNKTTNPGKRQIVNVEDLQNKPGTFGTNVPFYFYVLEMIEFVRTPKRPSIIMIMKFLRPMNVPTFFEQW